MFGWLFGKKEKKDDGEIKKSFEHVKKDFSAIGEWIKHLDKRDKQLFDVVNELKEELSSIKTDVESLREGIDLVNESVGDQQVFKKKGVLAKQTAVYDVENGVQTPVQTGNFYEILKGLSSNERLLVLTLMNSDMKLSYEDLALLLGKERSTVRGQINAIKQKSEGLIEEIVEKNGKKRVFVPDEVRQKLAKYAKVRVKKKKKVEEKQENEAKSET